MSSSQLARNDLQVNSEFFDSRTKEKQATLANRLLHLNLARPKGEGQVRGAEYMPQQLLPQVFWQSWKQANAPTSSGFTFVAAWALGRSD